MRLYGFGVSEAEMSAYHYHDEVKGVEAAHSFGFQSVFLQLLRLGGFIVSGGPLPFMDFKSSCKVGEFINACHSSGSMCHWP